MDIAWKPGDRVRRTRPDSHKRYWVGVVLGVRVYAEELEVTVRWDHKKSEVWFYQGRKIAELEHAE